MADFTVHDIVVQHQVRLTSGKPKKVTHLQFYVGDSGPFLHDFEGADDTPAARQAYIQQTVNDLRSTLDRVY